MTTTNPAQKGNLLVALELSNKNWRLAFSNGQKVRHVQVVARDLRALKAAIEEAKEKLGLAADCPVYSCYEAGRDGFWIHRALEKLGVRNVVVEPASIEVSRRGRRVKTDRLDADSLVRMLMRYVLHGEKKVWRVVVVPGVKEEEERQLNREYRRLRKERGEHLSRIRSLLALHGVRVRKVVGMDPKFLRDWEGRELPVKVQEDLRREQARLALVDEQLREVERELRQGIREPQTAVERTAAKLSRLRGIGVHGAATLAREVFGWRRFGNRRQVGAYAGLTGTAYASGQKVVEQGISKAGNPWVRSTMVELAWMWIWHQRESELTQWFVRRFGSGGKRARRIGIVALARKLLVALWRYVEFDEVPAGAIVAA